MKIDNYKEEIIREETFRKKLITILLKYGIGILFGAGIVVLYLWLRDFTLPDDPQAKYKMLSDAFTIPGVLYLMVGLLIFLTNKGSLDALGYMAKRAVRMLIPFSKKPNESYSEYVEKKRKLSGYSFIIFIGLLFMAIAIVFIILFYKN